MSGGRPDFIDCLCSLPTFTSPSFTNRNRVNGRPQLWWSTKALEILSPTWRPLSIRGATTIAANLWSAYVLKGGRRNWKLAKYWNLGLIVKKKQSNLSQFTKKNSRNTSAWRGQVSAPRRREMLLREQITHYWNGISRRSQSTANKRSKGYNSNLRLINATGIKSTQLNLTFVAFVKKGQSRFAETKRDN